MKTLPIAPGIGLPIDVVTQKCAFLGRTGSGKTYAATKLAELMLDADAQIVAIDPVGKWHGLRLAGKGPGFEIPVFGGLAGDVPLEPTSGALVADVIVDRCISAVLDVSQMISSDQTRFATDFATRLFQRKKAAPSAIHLFLEECQEFVPQNHQRGEERMLHAFERLVKLGRNFGIGVSLVSQRPQEVNKKALNQTECLFAFQMTGPQERKAMVSWIGELSDKSTAVNISDALPSLDNGRRLLWSPSWLKVNTKTRVFAKRTADVSSTPKVGAKAHAAQKLTPIDLKVLSEAMASTIEKARQDDPKALRVRIAELEAVARKEVVKVERVEVPAVSFHDLAMLDSAVKAVQAAAAGIVTALARVDRAKEAFALAAEPRPPARAVDRKAPPAVQGTAPAHGEAKLPAAQRKILTALAQSTDGCTKVQIAIRTGYAHSGGGFNNAISWLRTRSMVEGDGGRMRIADAGLAALGPFEPLPSGNALREWWRAQLGKAERGALDALAAAYPSALSKEQVAQRAGYEVSGGGFNNALSKLRTLELIEGRGELRASGALFGA